MLSNYNQTYNEYLKIFENNLSIVFNSLLKTAPETIKNAMTYAVVDGGKRIRPVLSLASAKLVGLNFDEIKEFSVAIECIHSYSLVHDDLPCMDNDDYRRGKLSTHKKFGEANGVLAGDALLNFAFELCLNKPNFNDNDVKALRFLSECAGYCGMIAGQVLDLESEGANADKDLLYKIFENKTAKLIIAPLIIPSILKDGKYYKELYEFGYNLGILFQITDDIIDVEGSLEEIGKTPNKDAESNKLTSVKVFGLTGAKKKANLHYQKCKNALQSVPNSEFLLELADKIYKRKK